MATKTTAVRFTPTADPCSFLVNGSFTVHWFAGDPCFRGDARAELGWGYYLPHPWPGWVHGFPDRWAAALAGCDALNAGPTP